MFKIVLIPFLVYSTVAFCLPNKIKMAIDQIGIKTGDLIFIMNHSECASCLNVDLTRALKYYENHPENIYFINENKQGKEKMEIKLIASGFKVDPGKIVINKSIYNYLNDKLLVQFNGKKFVEKFNIQKKNPWKSDIKIIVADSVELPNRRESIPYDLLEIGNKQYFLSSDFGQITYLEKNNLNIVDLYSLIDTSVLLNILKLDTIDFKLTQEFLKERSLVGNRFVEFKSFCPSFDENYFYISLIVSSRHLYTQQEKKELMTKYALAKSAFSKDINVVATCEVAKALIVKLNLNGEVLEYFRFSDIPKDYFVHIHSPFFINQNEVYANTFYYPEKYDDNFYHKNFLLEYLNLENNLISHSNFSEELKSKWYDHPKRYSNFTETSFQKIEDNVFLSTNSLTYWYNVTNKTVFEIPLKEIEKLAKKEKNKRHKKNFPSFSNLGILKYSPTEYFGFFRSPITAQIYYASFTEDGHFNKLEKLEIDTSYNGIIQVLNNRLVRTKEEQMIIYKLIKTSLQY